MLRQFGQYRPPSPTARPVVALGMFDGVHLGHQAILSRTCRWAKERGEPALALTFDVHPRRLLPDQTAPEMITSLEHRLQLLEGLGLDLALILTFDQKLAATSAPDFARNLLAKTLHASGIVLGERSHFGRGREGDAALLTRMGQELGLTAEVVPSVLVAGSPVSSTAIRAAVGRGEIELAAAMLGRPVSVLGTVVPGQGLGRQLGFPTLNLDPHHELRPPQGVYLTKTRCGSTWWNSVTNIGHRPTAGAANQNDTLVEAHLLDYHGDLYGQVVEVVFLRRLREERKFAGREELTNQIAADVARAKAEFASGNF